MAKPMTMKMPKRKGITHKIVTIVFNISSVED